MKWRRLKVGPMKVGFIYVLVSDCGNYTKIGVSRRHPDNGRKREIEGGCPFTLSLLITRSVENPQESEAGLHRKYDEFWIKGEWFRLENAHLEQLKLDVLALPEKELPISPEIEQPEEEIVYAIKPKQPKVYKPGKRRDLGPITPAYSFPNLAQHYRNGTGPFKVESEQIPQ